MVCSRDVCRLSMDLYCRRLTCAGRFHCAARSLNCRGEARRKGEGEGNRVRSRARSSWIILQIYSSSTFSLSRPYTEDGGRGRRRPKESRKKRGETECSVHVHVRTYVVLKGGCTADSRESHFYQFTPIGVSVCARDRIAALLATCGIGERSPIRESTLVYILFAAASVGLLPTEWK